VWPSLPLLVLRLVTFLIFFTLNFVVSLLLNRYAIGAEVDQGGWKCPKYNCDTMQYFRHHIVCYVTNARAGRLANSSIPYMLRLLNVNSKENHQYSSGSYIKKEKEKKKNLSYKKNKKKGCSALLTHSTAQRTHIKTLT
jgi:hypothetical protein